MFRLTLFGLLVIIVSFGMCACAGNTLNSANTDAAAEIPEIPEDIEYSADGVPMINVYVKDTDTIEKMDIETYLEGVLAGEMRNDWPMEALKAQAILARTYTLKFLDTKTSKYDGADISTDVTEAQAYNADNINDRIKEAVRETRGIVMTYDGELPHAWFHAHSGGMTELATIGIEYKEDPSYIVPVDSRDSEKAPEDVKSWTASFTYKEVIKACKDSGIKVDSIETVEIGKTGVSGRAENLKINGTDVSAPTFRINIGADKLKSTMIKEITVANGTVTFHGSGYGHGVGMSQWGAYALAEKGATAQTIVSRYFRGVTFADLWE